MELEDEESYTAPPPQRILVPPPDIDELDPRFSEAEFDMSWLLAALPVEDTQPLLEKQLLKLTYHQSVVESQLLDMVNMNHDKIIAGMLQATELKTDLTVATIHVGSSRQALQRGETRLIRPILTILSKIRKRARILTVYRTVRKIQTVLNLMQESETLVSQNKLYAATKLYLQCSHQLSPLVNVTSLAGTRERNQIVGKQIKKRLAATLSGLCSNFDNAMFSSIVKSYILLEESDTLGQSLKKAFMDSISKSTRESVTAHVQGDLAELGVLSMKIDELCAQVPTPIFFSCFRDTANIVAAIMHSAYKVVEALANPLPFLDDVPASNNLPTSSLASPSTSTPSSPVASSPTLSREHLCEVLRQAGTAISDGFEDIWARVQHDMTAVIIKPITVAVDEFVQIISWGYQLISIGEMFSKKSHYDGFKKALVKQSQDYIKRFHRESFEYLRATLEAERWCVLPLQGEFRLADIKEFRHLFDSQETTNELFDKFLHLKGGALFDSASNNDATVSPASENKEDKEVRLVTAASLTVARFIGRYLQVMRNVEPLANDALLGVTELFEFYLYSVFTLFGISSNQFFSPTFRPTLYPSLRKAVLSVRDRVEKGEFGGGVFRDQMLPAEPPKPIAEELEKERHFDRLRDTKKLFTNDSMKMKSPPSPLPVRPPTIVRLVSLNESVNLSNKDTLFGSVERAIASESVVFLTSVLKENQSVMTARLPTKAVELIKYAETVAQDFRTYMYRNIAPFLISQEKLGPQLAGCQWQLSGPCLKPNAYVSTILALFEDTGKALAKISGVEQLPNQVRQSLWTEVVDYLIEILLGAYSRIKACNTEGRKLLSLDLNELKTNLEKITQIRLTNWSHVMDYADAYFLSHSQYLRWVVEHPFYTPEQYTTLWHLGPGSQLDSKKLESQRELEAQILASQQAKERNS